MDDHTITLPADIEALKQLCLMQQEQLQAHEKTLQEKEKTLHEKENQIDLHIHHIETLEEFIRFLQQKKYSRSSERHVNQMGLFDDEELPAIEDVELNATEIMSDNDTNTQENQSPQNKTRGRPKLPADLPRIAVYQ